MGSLTTALTFVWITSVLVFLAQAAVMDINPSSNGFCNMTGTVMEEYVINNSDVIMPDSEGVSSKLNPTTAESGLTETSSVLPFVDAIASVKSWISNTIDYITAIVMSPYHLLKCIPGLPPIVASAVSLIWYGLTIFLFLAFIFGRVV